MLSPPRRNLSAPSKSRPSALERAVDWHRHYQLHQQTSVPFPDRDAETLAAPVRTGIGQRLSSWRRVPVVSSPQGRREIARLAFATSRLRKAIRRKACLVGAKNSSPPLPSNLSLLWHSYAGARLPHWRSERPAFPAKARTWPKWNRPCSPYPRADKSAGFCTG